MIIMQKDINLLTILAIRISLCLITCIFFLAEAASHSRVNATYQFSVLHINKDNKTQFLSTCKRSVFTLSKSYFECNQTIQFAKGTSNGSSDSKTSFDFEIPELNLHIDETIEPESGNPEDFFRQNAKPPDATQIGGIPFQFQNKGLDQPNDHEQRRGNGMKDASKIKDTAQIKDAANSDKKKVAYNSSDKKKNPWYLAEESRGKVIRRFPSLIGFPIIGHSGPSSEERGKSCFRERSGYDWICIEGVNWPDSLASVFDVKSLLYRGTKAIVRYRNGKIDRINTLFHSSKFNIIAEYLREEFGLPAKIRKRSLVQVSGPAEENISISWNFKDTEESSKIIEIRLINDIRGLFPDRKHGVLLLYDEMSESIFEQVEISDFMLHQLRKGDPEYLGQ